jgi:hypothetical protein
VYFKIARYHKCTQHEIMSEQTRESHLST